MPKPYRRKRIGDSFRKFKQPRKEQMWWTAQRKFLEKTMEEDHRAGLPLRACMYTSHVSGLPDGWFFDKAKEIGYKFDDPRKFAKEQLFRCFKTADHLESYADTFIHVVRLLFSKEEFETLGPKFREEILVTMRREQAKGKPITFGMGKGSTRNPRKLEYVAGSKGRLVRWNQPNEQERPPEVIGDPLRKFKQSKPEKQECPPKMRRMLEWMMEEDHRAGRPLHVALVTASNGVPDKWFFDKARALGYHFDDEFKWWSAQVDKLFASAADSDHKTDLEESLKKLEAKCRREQTDEAFEQAITESFGSVEQWRSYCRQILQHSYDEGRTKAEQLAKQKRASLH